MKFARELGAMWPRSPGWLSNRRPRPASTRCEELAAWAPRTAEAGHEAVARARRNGLMDEDYGLLLDLLSR